MPETMVQDEVAAPEQIRAAIEPLVAVGYIPAATDVAMLRQWPVDVVAETARMLSEFMLADQKTFRDQADGQNRLYAWLQSRERGRPLPTPKVTLITPAVAAVFPQWHDVDEEPRETRTVKEQLAAKAERRLKEFERMGIHVHGDTAEECAAYGGDDCWCAGSEALPS